MNVVMRQEQAAAGIRYGVLAILNRMCPNVLKCCWYLYCYFLFDIEVIDIRLWYLV